MNVKTKPPFSRWLCLIGSKRTAPPQPNLRSLKSGCSLEHPSQSLSAGGDSDKPSLPPPDHFLSRSTKSGQLTADSLLDPRKHRQHMQIQIHCGPNGSLPSQPSMSRSSAPWWEDSGPGQVGEENHTCFSEPQQEQSPSLAEGLADVHGGLHGGSPDRNG